MAAIVRHWTIDELLAVKRTPAQSVPFKEFGMLCV